MPRPRHKHTGSPRAATRTLGGALLLLLLSCAACQTAYQRAYPRTPPPQAYENYLRARLLREHGQTQEALDAIALAIAADPDALTPRVEQADLLRIDGRHDQALALIRELVDDFPREPAPALVHARILQDSGQTAHAADVLDALLRAHPDHTEATFLRAELAIEADDLPRARQVLEDFLQHNPGHRRAWLALGNTAFLLGEHHTAARALEESTHRDARNELAWLRLAESHRALGNPAAREQALADCVEALPQSRDCKVALLTAVADQPQTDDLEHRIDTLVLAVPHDPADLDDQTLARLAMRLLDTLPLEASSPFIERVIERRPTLVDLAWFLGQRRHQAGDATGALWALQQVPGDSQRFPDAAFLRGQIQLQLGRHDEALDNAQALADNHPDRVEGPLLLADALAAAERFDEALEALASATETLPRRRLQLELATGRIHELAGHPERAEALYRALLDRAASDEPQPLDAAAGSRHLARARFALASLRLERSAAHTPSQAELDEIATLAAQALAALPELQEPWQQALARTNDPELRRALEQRLP